MDDDLFVIPAGELRPTDVLDGLPITRVWHRREGVRVEVIEDGDPRYMLFGFTDQVSIRARPKVTQTRVKASKDSRRMIVTVVGPERTMLMGPPEDRPYYDEGTSVILEVAAPDDILVEDEFGELDWQEHGAYARLTVEEARAIGQALLRAADG